MAAKSDLGAARAPNTLGLLKNHEADWMLQRTLAYMNVNAAEIGEVRTVAQHIDERDADSLPTEWAGMATIVEAHGDKALADGDQVAARQAFLRASNYFRAAEYGCVPSHPRFTYDHCMLDNHSRMQQVAFAWLDETLTSLEPARTSYHG